MDPSQLKIGPKRTTKPKVEAKRLKRSQKTYYEKVRAHRRYQYVMCFYKEMRQNGFSSISLLVKDNENKEEEENGETKSLQSKARDILIEENETRDWLLIDQQLGVSISEYSLIHFDHAENLT